MFVSHETYTPARGGSAAAEIYALRRVFGEQADADRDRQHQGHHGPLDGRGRRGHRRDQGAGDRPRAGGAELPRHRPGARRAQPLQGRPLPRALRAAPRRRVRLADQHAAAALDAGRRRPATYPRGARLRATGSPTRRSGRRGCAASPPGRAAARGRQAPPARGRHGPGDERRAAARRVAAPVAAPAPVATATPAAAPAPVARRRRAARARAPRAAAAPAPVAASRRAPAPRGPRRAGAARAAPTRGHHGRDPGDRRRPDRLPGRHARPRPRPRSRPRHRHRQTGRDVRRHPRALRRSPATTPSSSATTRPCATSSASSKTAPGAPAPRPPGPRPG